MKILVTGSDGLIGGEAVSYFDHMGHVVVGADNNMRREFFGPAGDTLWNRARIFHKASRYYPTDTDIRDRGAVWSLFKTHGPFDVVIHCAAQPSHDKARDIPLTDFDVNALGTINLLEQTRQRCPGAIFIFTSTNKVYGDAPNEIPLVERATRFEYARPEDAEGIDERCRIDRSMHSIFGASKVAADVMVQEYGRYYGMRTCVFRGGCLTGPGHSGVELHGFLSYLASTAVSGNVYKIYGHKGKQVRDNIHSVDVVKAMEEVIKNPPPCGEVYNMGGGRENSVSVIEAIAKIEKLTGRKISHQYVDSPRAGDHICYYTNLSKFRKHYPNWRITKSVDDTLEDILKQMYWGVETDDKETLSYPLTEDSVVFDVGGFRGAWSDSILQRYNPHVHIFEPVPEFRDACAFRFRDKPKVKVHGFGLSDATGRIMIAKQGMNSSNFRGSAGQRPMPLDRINGDPTPESVEVKDVVEFMGEEGVRNVDLISINIEGGEYPLLRRMLDAGLVGKFANIQIQFHDFVDDAKVLRDGIREDLQSTHVENFNLPFVWEAWRRK